MKLNYIKWVIGLLVVIIVGGILHASFLLSPLAFIGHDPIITQPYSGYRRPIHYQVMYLDNNIEETTVNDVDKSAKVIFNELRKSEILGWILDEELQEDIGTFAGEASGRLIIAASTGRVLEYISWYGKDANVLSTMIVDKEKDMAYDAFIKMTPRLKEEIDSIFEQVLAGE